MGLLHRLKRLEELRPKELPLSLVCVDEEGHILDDGSEKIRPWIGRHHREVPGNCKIIIGVDPLVVLGLREAESE